MKFVMDFDDLLDYLRRNWQLLLVCLVCIIFYSVFFVWDDDVIRFIYASGFGERLTKQFSEGTAPQAHPPAMA